jgi:DNA-binding transcriptional ArsR family regulator
MVQHQYINLDAVFGALSDPTRRAVLESLSKGSLPVTELATPHSMSLTGFMKHLRVLEDAGLVGRSKDGRVVQCTLLPEPMQGAAAWLAGYQQFWSERLDSLARYLDQREELRRGQTTRSQSARRSPLPVTTAPRPRKSGSPGRIRKR